ncbi:hypothetical protein EDD22DRAFT_945768 [Suillus occidentalis]|nr:hypothetical protein EDD22DRAFT_945768 [Suillus occidentalis]
MSNMTDASVSTQTCFRSLASLLLKSPSTIEVLPGDASIWIPDVAERSRSLFCSWRIILVYLRKNFVGLTSTPCLSSLLHVRLPGLHTLENPSNHTMSSVIQDLIDSSAVLILMNPAYQTALNARKQLIARDLIAEGPELKFTAAYLRVGTVANIASLWYHRRWPSSTLYPTTSFSRCLRALSRNYFGWNHRTICIQSALVPGVHSNTSDVFTEIFAKEIANVMQWIESHVSDYSAVHHLKTLAPHFCPTIYFPCLDTLSRSYVHFRSTKRFWQYLPKFVASFVLPLQSTRMTEQENESPSGVQHACHFLKWRNQRLK